VYEPGSGEPQSLEVHLVPEGGLLENERAGADLSEVRYKGQVVKTPPGTPLELPAGINEFDLSVGGTSGKLRIRPVVVDQHATERRVLGQEFRAVWEA